MNAVLVAEVEASVLDVRYFIEWLHISTFNCVLIIFA